MADWTDRISSIVFTRIKNEFSSTLKTKYKMTDSNFSTVGSSDTPAVFPFVYVQILPGIETSEDLEGTSINGALFTFQIDVTDNKSQTRAKEVMSEIKRIMKRMSFKIVSMPNFTDTKDTHRVTARFRRQIDKNDTL